MTTVALKPRTAADSVARPIVTYEKALGKAHIYTVCANNGIDEVRNEFMDLLRECDDVIGIAYVPDSKNCFKVVYARSQSMGLNKLMYTAWSQLQKLGF